MRAFQLTPANVQVYSEMPELVDTPKLTMQSANTERVLNRALCRRLTQCLNLQVHFP